MAAQPKRALLAAIAAFALAGCPGKDKALSKMDWRPELAAYFDDQLDLVRVRVKFMGKWNREYEEKYLARVGYSDAIIVGVVKTLYYDTRWDKSRGLLYDFEVRDLIKGGLDDKKTLNLAVSTGELTGDSVSAREEIVGQPFFLYLKWVDVKEGTFHWHLSPFSKETAEEVRSLIRSAEGGAKAIGGTKDIDATPPEGATGESAPTSARPSPGR